MQSIIGRQARGAEYNEIYVQGTTSNVQRPNRVTKAMSLRSWIKKLGFWGFMFFLLKGLLWLTVPALIAIFATD
jgi:hypothetical protein